MGKCFGNDGEPRILAGKGAMEVFICYPKAAKERAAQVTAKLRSQGHRVFFDEDSLPSGQDYDERIMNAVNSCDLFLFFITPESVGAGKYTLTELGYAKRRWPNPRGRVLPVMVEATAFERIDPYLTEAVTVLQTKGNFATEVANALREHFGSLHGVFPKSAKRHWLFVVTGLSVASILAALSFLISEPKKGHIGAPVLANSNHDSSDSIDGNSGQPEGTSPTQSDGTRRDQEDRFRGTLTKPINERTGHHSVSKGNAKMATEPQDKDRRGVCGHFCLEQGMCTPNPPGSGYFPCRATSEEDCQRASQCSESGECGLDKESDRCRPKTEEHCQASKICKRIGRCSLHGRECIAKRAEDCLNSAVCIQDGKCSATKDGWCDALSDADCQRSRKCKEKGACHLFQHGCYASPNP